jgi:hypothetical protein
MRQWGPGRGLDWYGGSPGGSRGGGNPSSLVWKIVRLIWVAFAGERQGVGADAPSALDTSHGYHQPYDRLERMPARDRCASAATACRTQQS